MFIAGIQKRLHVAEHGSACCGLILHTMARVFLFMNAHIGFRSCSKIVKTYIEVSRSADNLMQSGTKRRSHQGHTDHLMLRRKEIVSANMGGVVNTSSIRQLSENVSFGVGTPLVVAE